MTLVDKGFVKAAETDVHKRSKDLRYILAYSRENLCQTRPSYGSRLTKDLVKDGSK